MSQFLVLVILLFSLSKIIVAQNYNDLLGIKAIAVKVSIYDNSIIELPYDELDIKIKVEYILRDLGIKVLSTGGAKDAFPYLLINVVIDDVTYVKNVTCLSWNLSVTDRVKILRNSRTVSATIGDESYSVSYFYTDLAIRGEPNLKTLFDKILFDITIPDFIKKINDPKKQ